MATYTTYDQVGQAEDVSNIITTITPTRTPFQTMIGTDGASARLVEWQEDALDPVQDNAVVEGADAVDMVLVPTVMRQNYTQILEKTIKVSGTADEIKTYGRAKETAYQLAKKGAEIKRDLEHVIVGREGNAAVGDSATLPRRLGSAFGQDATANPLMGVVLDNTGTPRPLTEALVLEGSQRSYEEGGEPNTLMVKPADSIIVADFAKSTGRERDFGTGTRVVNAVDVYVSPFGRLNVVINRFILATEAILFNPNMWKLSWLRRWRRTMLAKTGDNEKHQLLGEVSLKHMNYKASVRITDLN